MKKRFTTILIRKLLILSIFILFTKPAVPQIYVSTTGSDTNAGTIDLPLKTIPAAVTKAVAGDTIYVRGGVYTITATLSLSKDGTSANRFYLFAYNDERPLLDFSSMAVNSNNRGINLRGDYWHVKGFDVKKAGDNGMNLSGSNNIVEFCSFSENFDTGLQLSGGASNNYIINCDSYFNADPDNGDADGFAPKLDVGTNNYFYGCRAWQNSDDGWDGYMRGANDVNTKLENCWSFKNGYLKTGNASSGNGNGFKMGGSDDRNLMHNMTLVNCTAFDNRVKGFDQNNNRGSMTLYNCTGYRNNPNYSVTLALNSGKTLTVTNCLALGNYGSLGSFAIQTTNSWQSPFIVTTDDFKSIDTTGVRGPRKADGSLPDVDFMHLVPASDLVNAGTDIGNPYIGTAPDLGAFEYNPPLPVELTSFTVSVEKNNVLLKWSTATESNNLGFEIQKSSSKNNFYTIGFVRGAGSSTVINNYIFSDNNISASPVYYRLKQIDYDGSYSFSNEVLINNNIPSESGLLQNYPNPFNPETNFEFKISPSSEGLTTLKVYDILGNEAAVLVNEVKEPGTYKIKFNASALSSGIYFYELISGSFKQSKKMLLLK